MPTTLAQNRGASGPSTEAALGAYPFGGTLTRAASLKKPAAYDFPTTAGAEARVASPIKYMCVICNLRTQNIRNLRP